MDHAQLILEMARHEAGCPQRTQHFMKVWGFARAIGQRQGLPAEVQDTLEAAAIVHDIGIRPSLEKYGDADGPHQEAEGPPLARAMLEKLGYPAAMVQRVCALVGRHHTTTGIDGPDCQILIEADFLVNIHEGQYPREKAAAVLENIFKTEAGRALCRLMFLD